jgi:hypothetical protein
MSGIQISTAGHYSMGQGFREKNTSGDGDPQTTTGRSRIPAAADEKEGRSGEGV